MEKEQYKEILEKYLSGRASAEEVDFLYAYYNLFMADVDVMQLLDANEKEKLRLSIKAHIDQHLDEVKGVDDLNKVSDADYLNKVQGADRLDEAHGNDHLDNVTPAEPIRRKLWPRVAAAAAILLVVGAGLYFYNSRHFDNKRDLVNYANDIKPGHNGATLTLANGKVINLSDKQTGVIVGNEKLTYDDGSIVDSSMVGSRHPDIGRDLALAINTTLTVQTAKGQTYQITLPDGTKVWLNAASKLTYTPPVKERGYLREVKLSGEAYFEVFRNKKQPFRVNFKTLTLSVLGTHFNVSAYEDDKVTKATLLEGSIRVEKLFLKPNEQFVAGEGKGLYQQTLPDATSTIAWKEGNFVFKSETIADIMRKVQRWYDVQVVYTDQSLADIKFSGTISRYENVSSLLDILQATERLQFNVEGRKITVSAKK